MAVKIQEESDDGFVQDTNLECFAKRVIDACSVAGISVFCSESFYHRRIRSRINGSLESTLTGQGITGEYTHRSRNHLLVRSQIP